MKFSLSREALLKPLQLVVGVVERRQTLPILSMFCSAGGLTPLGNRNRSQVEIIGYTDAAGAEEGAK